MLQKVITGDESWIYGSQSSIISMETAVRTKTEKCCPSSIDCETFAYSFIRLQGALCIMSSCHRVERSIRNIIWKLCAICTKPFARNDRICGRTKKGSCITIIALFTNRDCTLLFGQITQLGYWRLWLFLVSETEEAHERTTLRYDWRDKDVITGSQDRIKQDNKEVLNKLEKTLAQLHNIWWGLLWSGQNRYSWRNKWFLKKHKIRDTFRTQLVCARLFKSSSTFQIEAFLVAPSVWKFGSREAALSR